MQFCTGFILFTFLAIVTAIKNQHMLFKNFISKENVSIQARPPSPRRLMPLSVLRRLFRVPCQHSVWPSSARQRNVSLEGRWRPAFRCLLGGSVVVDSLFNVLSIGLWGFCVWSLFCYASRSIVSNFEVLEGILAKCFKG